MAKIQRAILSVFDKHNLEELAGALHRRGVEILSSGGTARYLEERGIPVLAVEGYTGSPEILGGRVKTLHPRIFGGILARGTPEHLAQLEEQQTGLIDLVVVNLYPFSATVAEPGSTKDEIVEMIDIGGPSLIRAAAMNHERVTVVVDPADYGAVIEELEGGQGEIGEGTRRRLAGKAFAHTAAYDGAIVDYFEGLEQQTEEEDQQWPARRLLVLERIQQLRYGENPHQSAALYRDPSGGAKPAVVECEQLQGKKLSFNNYLDADAALNLVQDLPDTAVCILKHTNPCGAACNTTGDVVDAFKRAKATDPVSAFGGIVGSNTTVTGALAQELREIFIEAVVAPGYEPEALQILKKKKKLRLLRFPSGEQRVIGRQLRGVTGGILIQDFDGALEDLSQAEVVTKRPPTAGELAALDFAWRICKHVKSNAIVFAGEGQLLGVGAGQMSRVDSVALAATKAQLPLTGSVLASDAFFPFRDGLDRAVEAGATAVVQPGGSIRDKEVIEAADQHGVAMILTGVRHFRH
jgi:phosphoribosylaminoimidazolecarboxamide formyltransferase/IMP cyclohydrolase